MKVALLIAGYVRNYETSIEYIQNEIIKKFDDVDVYLHITKSENIEDKYLNQIEDSDIQKIVDSLNPITTIVENNQLYVSDNRINNVINLWSKLYKLNEIKSIRESESTEYDIVIRYRLDLNILTKNLFDYIIEDDVIYLPSDTKMDKTRLTNSDDGYLCDALAFGKSRIMNKYFNIYEYYGNNFLPVSETSLFEYLTNTNIRFKKIDIVYNFLLSKCNIFAICGDSGSGKSTLSELLKNCYNNSFTLECDRYHKWERHNKNWEKTTHLNPKSNYITKMEEDIFNLKLGNEIYQVDYDHHSGKFTEKQLINPSDNLIVCGLHSLYGDTNLYDLKIFMDTDENLKKKWKVRRDVLERGYSVDKVLESIEKRQKDFNEFIKPQRENADLVIRFFSEDDVDYHNLNNNESLSLEVSIGKNCKNLNTVLKSLTDLNIEYKINENNDFTIIIFDRYKEFNYDDNSFLKNNKTNSFYDIILYLIFHINFTV
jgi:uridine kinase